MASAVCVAVAVSAPVPAVKASIPTDRGHGVKIAFVLYEQFTALDLAGPYEVIARWPGAEVHFIATWPDPVRADAGLVVVPTGTLDSLTASAPAASSLMNRSLAARVSRPVST
jgi:hypothetical protein